MQLLYAPGIMARAQFNIIAIKYHMCLLVHACVYASMCDWSSFELGRHMWLWRVTFDSVCVCKATEIIILTLHKHIHVGPIHMERDKRRLVDESEMVG